MRRIMAGAAIAAALLAAGGATGAEPIEGRWRTANGETATIARCGADYCITVVSGPYQGKSIGRVSGSNGDYAGSLTDPSNDRTYAGTAKAEGDRLSLRGCALKVFCRSQDWTRR